MTETKKVHHTNAYLRIEGGCSVSDTTLKIHPDDIISLLEKWEDGAEFYMTITNSSSDVEIIKTTDIDFDEHTLTVERAQDGTTAKEWYNDAIMSCRLVADNLNSFIQKEGFRTVYTDPNGVLTPMYRGEKVFQDGQKIWWKSISGTDWQLVAGIYVPEIAPYYISVNQLENAGYYNPPFWNENTGEIHTMQYGYDSSMPVYVSTDLGDNFTKVNDTIRHIGYVIYVPSLNLYIGAGGGYTASVGIFSSTDLITWTLRQAFSSNTAALNPIWTGSMLVCASSASNQIFTSANGITWNTYVSPTTSQLTRIEYSSALGQFLLTGFDAKLYTSTDAQNWTQRTPDPNGYEAFNDTLNYPVYGNDMWLVFGGHIGSTYYVQKSTDGGLTWEAIALPERFNGCTFCGTKFVAGAPNKLYYSYDGEEWTAINSGFLSSYVWAVSEYIPSLKVLLIWGTSRVAGTARIGIY